MEFFEVVKNRRSIRAFRSTPIEEDKLARILEAANQAPSAGNLQAYQIIVVKKASARKILTKACGDQDFISQAPVVLAFCAQPMRSAKQYGTRGKQLYCIQDATIACAYAQLAATAVGLASVWVGAIFETDMVRNILQLGDDSVPVALLPLGYLAQAPEQTTRRVLQQLVRTVE